MRIAILPIEKEQFQKNNEFISSTYIAYLISYLNSSFPDDLIFPICDVPTLAKAKPDIVCIYSDYSETWNTVLKVIQEISENIRIPILIAGRHITYLPKTLPPEALLGIMGEAEETLGKVIAQFRDGDLSDKSLSRIPGIVFYSKNQKIITEKAKFVQDIDNLPLTRKSFYKMPGTWIPSLLTGRGEPTKNIYSPSDIPLRLHSAERLMVDLVDIMTFYPELRTIPVLDYLLLHDTDRFKRFAEINEETQMTKYLRLEVKAKSYQINEDILYILRYVLDVPKLTIDFVSPVESSQKELKENIVSLDEHIKILESCYKFNLNVQANFFIGIPNETREQITKNYWIIRNKYMRKYNDFSCNIIPLIPTPGSELWQRAVAKKLITDNINFDNFNSVNINEKTPILSTINNQELNKVIEEYKSINKKEDKVTLIEKKGKELADNVTQRVLDIQEDLFKKYEVREQRYDIIDPIIPEEHIKKYNFTISETIELSVKSKTKVDTFELLDNINNISHKYKYQNGKEVGPGRTYSKELISFSAIPVFEYLVKTPNISKLLQITDPTTLDLERIFSEDIFEINTINITDFNISKIKHSEEKKYDNIALLFALDSVSKPAKVLKYCDKVLDKNGTLIINFFNVKSILLLYRLVNDLNINKLFHGLIKNNMFSDISMINLLKKHGYIPISITPTGFPERALSSYTQRMTSGMLRKIDPNIDHNAYIFSYTFICKKIS